MLKCVNVYIVAMHRFYLRAFCCFIKGARSLFTANMMVLNQSVGACGEKQRVVVQAPLGAKSEGVLVAGEVRGQPQGTAKIPLSKVLDTVQMFNRPP